MCVYVCCAAKAKVVCHVKLQLLQAASIGTLFTSAQVSVSEANILEYRVIKVRFADWQ